MEITLVGMVIEFKIEQLKKALELIEVTESGIVMEVKEEHD